MFPKPNTVYFQSETDFSDIFPESNYKSINRMFISKLKLFCTIRCITKSMDLFTFTVLQLRNPHNRKRERVLGAMRACACFRTFSFSSTIAPCNLDENSSGHTYAIACPSIHNDAC